MSSVDTAWLRMDRPSNLMMIVGVLEFGGIVSHARLRRLLEQRLLPYRRFRQRPVMDEGVAWWEDDPTFDLDRHLVRHAHGHPIDDAGLRSLAGELAATALDPARPLWQFTLVRRPGRATALIARVHHCYADGIALIGVMMSLTDPTARSVRRPRPAPRRSGAVARGADHATLLQRFIEPVSTAVMSAVRDPGSAIEKYVDLVRNPGRLVEFARVGSAIGKELAQLATMPNDSVTRFKGKPGPSKRVAWTAPIPLDEVKAVGRALGCSVNDVLLSCVAGALSRHLRQQGDEVSGVEVRALVPVNLRSPGREAELGNRFGLVALELPLGCLNPVARVLDVNARMAALKGSYQAALTLGVLGLVGMCPQPVQQQVLDLLAAKATAVMTNVPGPQQQLYMAGVPLADMMFWVPQSGDIGMGVSILSYNDKVQFGLITDAGLTPDPEAVVAGFRPELETLLLTLLMEPWEGLRDPGQIEADLAVALAVPIRPAVARTRRSSAASPSSRTSRHRPRAAV